VLRHCCRCLALRQPDSWDFMNSSAHRSNVIDLALATYSSACLASRSTIGSLPSRSSLAFFAGLPGLFFDGGGRWFTWFWRRRRDSNPRYALRAYNGLANRRLQPLGHISAQEKPLYNQCLCRQGARTKQAQETQQTPINRSKFTTYFTTCLPPVNTGATTTQPASRAPC
jgi:hypothetical protein